MSPRYCLWGGGKRWVQIGSPTDRRIQIQWRWIADVERLTAAIGSAIKPAIQQTYDAFAGLARALQGEAR